MQSDVFTFPYKKGEKIERSQIEIPLLLAEKSIKNNIYKNNNSKIN